jgi:ATP-dependent Lhr-like helicase
VHQTLSILYSLGDAAPELLAQRLLGERTFRHISLEDFRLLLRHMLNSDLLEKTQEGRLMIGKKGEWLTNHYEFYTVFENPVEYSVREGAAEIGALYETIPVGEQFVLSGKTWEVLEIDKDKRIIQVKYIGGKSAVNWTGGAPGDIHTRVLRKMREVIVSGDEYGYLHHSAAKRLAEIRRVIRRTKAFAATPATDVFPLSPHCFGLFPWLGTRAMNALRYSLQSFGVEVAGRDSGDVILFVSTGSLGRLKAVLGRIKTAAIDVNTLPIPEERPAMGKYGEYIPPVLAKKQYLDSFVDVEEMQRELLPFAP